MTEKDFYDTLQSLLPAGLQFVNPYLDKVPLPQGDWAQMNIINIEPIAWNQSRYVSETQDNKGQYAYDIERVYNVQFDFYGESAYNNALLYQQNLNRALVETDGSIDLKTLGIIENRTALLENKKFMKRYGFDASMFVVDTITQEHPYIKDIKYKIVNRGNNFNKE